MPRNLVFLSITTSSESLAQSIQQFPATHRQLFRQLFLLFSCLGKHQLGLEGLEFRSEGQLCWTMVQVKLKIEVTQKMLGPTKYRLTGDAIAWFLFEPTKNGTKRLIFVCLAHKFENTRHRYQIMMLSHWFQIQIIYTCPYDALANSITIDCFSVLN